MGNFGVKCRTPLGSDYITPLGALTCPGGFSFWWQGRTDENVRFLDGNFVYQVDEYPPYPQGLRASRFVSGTHQSASMDQYGNFYSIWEDASLSPPRPLLTKVSPDGLLKWVVELGLGGRSASCVHVDINGQVWIGAVNATANDTLIEVRAASNGSEAFTVAATDRQSGPSGPDGPTRNGGFPLSMCSDASGNVFVVGMGRSGDEDFSSGDTAYVTDPETDHSIVAFNPSGSIAWTRDIPGDSAGLDARPTLVACSNASDSLYVSGYIQGGRFIQKRSKSNGGLANSVQSFGYEDAMVVDRDDQVYAGSGLGGVKKYSSDLVQIWSDQFSNFSGLGLVVRDEVDYPIYGLGQNAANSQKRRLVVMDPATGEGVANYNASQNPTDVGPPSTAIVTGRPSWQEDFDPQNLPIE